ncbi:hypothetical protein [Planctomyces sp. SH-PL62]|uniref:hypothetical protein n=1 Tax=Planctomyces sp. SH-PL62 TaxID=1636152 RepID=UPI00078D9000|nr:hypothetical protein [Planctomyces sp. SH-PL62]AMV36387.1 hypothetical protein VT85_03050 [Planctomyces sp. SH-PL62]
MLRDNLANLGPPRFPFLEASLAGLLLGLADIHIASEGAWATWLYAAFATGVALGFRHAGRAWRCWLPLGISPYLVQLGAIAYGYGPPYVGEYSYEARGALFMVVPATISLGLGSLIRAGYASYGRYPRPNGEPIAIIPQTRRELAASVAGVATYVLVMYWALYASQTVYAVGYDEARFRQIVIGMSADDVEELMGPPLRKGRWSSGTEVWFYTLGCSETSSYWRRWVHLEAGRVDAIEGDYWND